MYTSSAAKFKKYISVANANTNTAEGVLDSISKINNNVYHRLLAGDKILTNSREVASSLQPLGLGTYQKIQKGPIGSKINDPSSTVINIVKSDDARAVATALQNTAAQTKSKGAWLIVTTVKVDDKTYRVFNTQKAKMIDIGIRVFETLADGRLLIAGIRDGNGDASVFSKRAGFYGTSDGASPVTDKPDQQMAGMVYKISKSFINNDKPVNVKPEVYTGNYQTQYITFGFLPSDTVTTETVNAVLNDPSARAFLRDLKGDRGMMSSWHIQHLKFPKK